MSTGKRETRPVNVALLFLLLVVFLVAAYVGAYCLLVNGAVYAYAGGKIVLVSGSYRINHPAVAVLFAPVNQLDMWLRPGAWENPSNKTFFRPN